MKHFLKDLVVAALVTSALAVVTLGRAAADSGGALPDRDAAAGRQWKEKLGLNAEQFSKYLAALKAKEAGLQPLREDLRVGLRKLEVQLSEGAPEKDVQGTLEQLVQIRKAIALRDEQFEAGLSAFLTPSQRARLFVWRSMGAFRGKSPQGLEVGDFSDPASGEEVEPE
jgi:hypothetical protein